MTNTFSSRDEAVRVFNEHFPGAVAVEHPEVTEGPWGRGEEGWRNWVMENLDRQVAEYRAAGGADSLPPDPERYRMAHAMRQAEAWFGEPAESWKLQFRLVAAPAPAKRYGPGERGWQRWRLASIDAQIREYRAAKGKGGENP